MSCHLGDSPCQFYASWPRTNDNKGHQCLPLCWIGFLFGLCSMLGYGALSWLGKETMASVNALAAGAILAMIVDTMIPEAFEIMHGLAGFITVLGFLAAFMLGKPG